MEPVQYLVTIVAEEAAELGKAAIKILRYGWKGERSKATATNQQDLIDEYNDLLGTMEYLEQLAESELGINLIGLRSRKAIDAKKAKIYRTSKGALKAGTLSSPLPLPSDD